MKKKKRMKNKLNPFLMVLVVITISYITITLYKNYAYNTFQITVPNSQKITKKSYNKFKNLNYTETEIANIIQWVSNKNITYLIENKIESNIAMNFINETYYIDDYLEKYITYYKNSPNISFKRIITIINTHIDSPFYSNVVKTDTTLGKYVILNKHYYTDSSYPTEELVTISGNYHVNGTTVKLAKECYEAFLLMYKDAYNAGYGFKLKSAYRSYDTQISTYNYWVSKDGKNIADTYSAKPGHSEHQTGYAFDIRDYNYEYEDYSKSKSFKWLSTNAHKYGFIIRFPQGKEDITGYQYESWHYRYCGIECATYIYEHNITFEEYYEYFIKYGNPKNLS